jgi:hypothetical protein
VTVPPPRPSEPAADVPTADDRDVHGADGTLARYAAPAPSIRLGQVHEELDSGLRAAV